MKRAGLGFGPFLQRLPPELLAESMRLACSDAYDLLTLSHVDRRFRSIALSMADVWSHISSDMPTEILQLCLERSKNAGLHIVLEDTKSDVEDLYATFEDMESRFKSCLIETERRCARWVDVRIILLRYISCLRRKAHTFSAIYSRITTTHLTLPD